MPDESFPPLSSLNRRTALGRAAAAGAALGLAGVGRAAAQGATPALTPNAPGETVSLNGADIYYEVYGAGDPVVFVHGGRQRAQLRQPDSRVRRCGVPS